MREWCLFILRNQETGLGSADIAQRFLRLCKFSVAFCFILEYNGSGDPVRLPGEIILSSSRLEIEVIGGSGIF